MYTVIQNERGLELVTSRSSVYGTSSQKFLYYPANTLRKSNVILRLYFGNLRKLFFLLMLMLRNLNYIRNPNVVITLDQLT